MCRINDGVNPETSSGISRIGLVLVSAANRFVQLLLLFFVDFLPFALQLLQLDFHERARGGFSAHYRIPSRRPSKNKPWIVRFPAHRVMTGTKAASANHRNLGHHA